MQSLPFPLVLEVVIFVVLSLLYRNHTDSVKMATLGGVHESQGEVEGQAAAIQNSADVEGLARFAVEEHNKKEVLFLFCFTIFVCGIGFSGRA